MRRSSPAAGPPKRWPTWSARGHLYTFHRLVGEADFLLDELIDNLTLAGKEELAGRVADELHGRNVLPGRWTFQVLEEFDDGYYAEFQQLGAAVRSDTVGGRRHVLEAELKERRRSADRRGHEATPDDIAQ